MEETARTWKYAHKGDAKGDCVKWHDQHISTLPQGKRCLFVIADMSTSLVKDLEMQMPAGAPGLVGEAVALHEDELPVRARLEHVPGAQRIPARRSRPQSAHPLEWCFRNCLKLLANTAQVTFPRSPKAEQVQRCPAA